MNGAKSSEVALLRKWRRKMGALKQNENQVFNNLKKEIKQTEGGDENISLRSLLRMQTFIKWKTFSFFKYFSVLRGCWQSSCCTNGLRSNQYIKAKIKCPFEQRCLLASGHWHGTQLRIIWDQFHPDSQLLSNIEVSNKR